MILSVTLNPCIDRVMFVDGLNVRDTNRVVRTETDAGGKGLNLSRVVAELGGTTVATGFLGGGTGAHIRAVLDVQGVVHRFVPIAAETRTNFSVEDGQGPPTTFNDRGPDISERELAELFDLLPELFYAARWIAIGGSLPGGVPTDIYAKITEMAREAGLKVLVDADKDPMARALVAKPDLVKPNGAEASRLVGRDIATLDEGLAAASDLLPSLNEGGTAIISLGASGAVLASDDAKLIAKPPKVEVQSTIGSGDSLLAGYLWAIEEGLDQAEALKWGVACGAATATTSGAEIARKPVIAQLLPLVTVTG